MSSIVEPCPLPSGTIHFGSSLDGIGTPPSDCLLLAQTRSNTMSPMSQGGVITSAPPGATIPTTTFFDDAIEVPEAPNDAAAAFSNPQSFPTDGIALDRPKTNTILDSNTETGGKIQKSSRRSTRKEAKPKNAQAEKQPETAVITQGPKPKKRGRKPKQPPVGQDPGEDEELDEDGLPLDPRRRRVLERNRIAATKCRIRKRDEASALASREHAMEDQNRYLASCFDYLTAEIFQLKTQLLRHTDCSCVLIQKYIAHEAKKSVENMVGGSSQGPLGDGSPGYRDPSHLSSGESMKTNSEVGSVSTPWTTPFQQGSALTTPPESMGEQGMKEFPVMPMPYDAQAPMNLAMSTGPMGSCSSNMLTAMRPHPNNLGGIVWDAP